MAHLTRRSMLRGSLALAAAKTVGGPYVARAAATTAAVWFAQGFVQDEDVALRKAVADYEKQSGNKIELSIIPFAPERQKIISALTSGVVPDLVDSNPGEILQLYGWQDRWVDVSDVVEAQRSQFSEAALVPLRPTTTSRRSAPRMACRSGPPSSRATSGSRWSRRRA